MRTQKRIPRAIVRFSSASVMQCKVIQNILDNWTCWRVRSSDFVSPLSVLFVSSELLKIVVQSSLIFGPQNFWERPPHLSVHFRTATSNGKPLRYSDQSWSDSAELRWVSISCGKISWLLSFFSMLITSYNAGLVALGDFKRKLPESTRAMRNGRSGKATRFSPPQRLECDLVKVEVFLCHLCLFSVWRL